MEIKVSIVIPVYNSSFFLTECLDSLLSQRMEDIEIICVDDGSRDNSVSILTEYARKDSRIKVYYNTEESTGAAKARNLGLSKISGEYVLILDSDDIFDATLVEKVYQKALDTDAEIIIFDADKFDSDTGERIPTNDYLHLDLMPNSNVFTPEEAASTLFQLAHCVAWNKLFKRNHIQNFAITFFPTHVVDDMNFTLSAMVTAKKIAIVPEKLVLYRTNNNASQTYNMDRDPLSPIKALKKLLVFLEDNNLYSLYQETYMKQSVSLCLLYFHQLHEKKSLRILYDYLHSSGLKELNLTTKVGLNQEISRWVDDILILSWDEFLEKKQERDKNIITAGSKCAIYGYGMRFERVSEIIKNNGGTLVAVVDSSHQKQGQQSGAFVVLAPEKLSPCDIDCVCISTPNYFDAIKEKLLGLGFLESQISLA